MTLKLTRAPKCTVGKRLPCDSPFRSCATPQCCRRVPAHRPNSCNNWLARVEPQAKMSCHGQNLSPFESFPHGSLTCHRAPSKYLRNVLHETSQHSYACWEGGGGGEAKNMRQGLCRISMGLYRLSVWSKDLLQTNHL